MQMGFLGLKRQKLASAQTVHRLGVDYCELFGSYFLHSRFMHTAFQLNISFFLRQRDNLD